MKYVLLADLHLTINPLDEYRWQWLEKFTEWLIKNQPMTLVILGDVTENKDRHSNTLVNRFISLITRWVSENIVIMVITGNHDGIDVSKPFFRFINNMNNIRMITKPFSNGTCLFLPHSKNPLEEWKKLTLSRPTYIFMHQAINEAKTSSGFEMIDVVSSDYFKSIKAKIFSGDIHVPQQVGNVTYVGSPYPIYFGDNFNGRFITISEKDVVRSVYIPSISKMKLRINSLKELHKVDIKRDDQLNVEYMLDRTEQHKWADSRDKIRSYIKAQGGILVSLELLLPKKRSSLKKNRVQLSTQHMSDRDYIAMYARRNDIDNKFYIEIANNILKEVTIDDE